MWLLLLHERDLPLLFKLAESEEEELRQAGC